MMTNKKLTSSHIHKNTVNQICVIGGGVMGSGIAAIAANAGIKVLLLDIKSHDDPNLITKNALTRMLSTKPSPLSHPSRISFITPGNLDDDLEQIKDCHMIIEAIIEKLDIKQSLYNKLLPFLDQNTIIASNTSTLSLKSLKTGLPDWAAKNFMILHFFNPPRYMPLLELVSDKETSAEVKNRASTFITHFLGKEIVECKDTPGFIANRIGCFLLELSLRKTIEYKLTIEEIDQIFIQYLSFPNTGIFGLYDLIGLDVIKLISLSLSHSLPKEDRFVEIYTPLMQIDQMIKNKYTGRKGLGGFYRIKIIDGIKTKEVLNLTTGKYEACKKETLDYKNINQLISLNNNLAKATREILLEFGNYICTIVPEVSNNIYDIDFAMRLGYSWKYGPFEIFYKAIDNGFEWLAKHPKSDKIPFLHKKEYACIEQTKFIHSINSINKVSTGQIIRNNSCIVHELNNEAICFEITTKMNCLNKEIFSSLLETICYAETKKKNIYIYSDAPHFSAGADLQFFLDNIKHQNWYEIESFLKLGQETMMSIKYAKIPIISIASGAALGGGCELLLHSHFIVAHEQLNSGLVEVGVGLIPSWGGIKEMIVRGAQSSERLIHNLKNIILQNKTTSADYFTKDYLVNLKINMNRKYLLQETMDLQNQKFPSNTPNVLITIPKFDLEQSLDYKALDSHTQYIATLLQTLSGKTIREKELLDFERNTFMKLIKLPETERKIQKILLQ